MSEQSKQPVVHHVVLALDSPMSPETPVGGDLTLTVRVSCSRGCDLRGGLVRVIAGEETLAAHALVTDRARETGGDGTRAAETDAFIVKAPEAVGAHGWTVEFRDGDVDGPLHEPVSLPLSFATRPHETSLAVWDIPSPIVAGRPFTIKVGARSSGACALHGAAIEILDDGGALVGSGRLGETPWPGTAALYWTGIELTAPTCDLVATWTARFADTDVRLPHREAAAHFSLVSVKPPEHTLTVTFVDKDTQQPIENAHIRLGAFRGLTGASGVAALSVPKGTYEIQVWHIGYEVSPTAIDVADDRAVHLEGAVVEDDDVTARMWM